MPAYLVRLRGENFVIEVEGEARRMGFHTTRWVRAKDAREAELAAVALVRNDESLRQATRRDAPVEPRIFLEEIVPQPWWKGFRSGTGYAFWDMDEEDAERAARSRRDGDAVESANSTRTATASRAAPASFDQAMDLAGFFAAHGVWCVMDGETLTPMLARESEQDGRELLRMATGTLEEGVARGQAELDSNPGRADRAVLVYDGYLHLPTGRTDALMVVVRSYANPVATLTMAVPYRHAESPQGFAVHRPKFLAWDGPGEADYAAWGAMFFAGVDSHEEGAKAWDAHGDDSR